MSSRRGKNVSEDPSLQPEQLGQVVANLSLESGQDDGQWEVYSKKSRNRAGGSAANDWNTKSSAPKGWGNQFAYQKQGAWNTPGLGRAAGSAWPTHSTEFRRPAGRGSGRPYMGTTAPVISVGAPQPATQVPPQHQWNWKSRTRSSEAKDPVVDQGNDGISSEYPEDDVEKDDDADKDDDSDVLDDTDDDSDGYDSDASQQSHEMKKKNKWFEKFFEIMDELPVEEINDPVRQWHCPACQGGPGAIDWYRGLQPLLTHAKTKGSKRVRLHREFAELLDEELRRKGTSVVPPGEAFGRWQGLGDGEKDHEIVWPPMVIVMNTRLDKDDNEKWIGMGNQELLEYFSSFAAIRARHSYGPQGHRGMSVLIFESSARGYLEAERLHRHFAEQGTDREAWDRRRVLFYQGGKRQLYGFLAEQEDLEIFNNHCQGKSRLKYEMRSYHEMVVKQIRQMSEDNQQLTWLKNKIVKEKMHSKALQESFNLVSDKLRRTMEDNRIVMERTKKQHEQNKEEMAFQEDFFKNQIRAIHEAREAKENDFEMLQQERRKKVKELNANPANPEDFRVDEIDKFIQLQDKEMGEFVRERDEEIRKYKESYSAMKKKHWEEEVELEKQFNDALDHLMEKYSEKYPASVQGDSASSSSSSSSSIKKI